MRINIEASAEELSEIGVDITEIPNLIIIALDSCISLPGYTVTVNEPSAIQAQLVAALKAAKTWHNGEKWRDSSDPSEVLAWEQHRDIIAAALTAAGAQS